MCEKQNQRLAAFLRNIFDKARQAEALLKEEERKPLIGCAVLMDTGNIFGTVLNNVANQDNPDGSSPVADVLGIAEQHKALLRTEFQPTVVAITTTIDPKSAEPVPFDWNYFSLEKRQLEEAGLDEVLYVCTNSEQHMMLAME